MIAQEIQDALEGRVATLPDEVARWNAYEPEIGTPWLQASIPAIDRRPMGNGANSPFLWTGVLSLVVKQPVADGLAPANARAMAILEHFPRALTLVVGAARVIISEASPLAQMSTADWRSLPVQIRFECTEQAP